MRQSRRSNAISAILFTCMALLSQQSLAAENPQVMDGSNVTVLYQITVPGVVGLTVQDVGQFVQGKHQILPALERVIIGMKAGEEKKVELSVEEGFGPYDDRKKKTIPRTELPAGAKEGDMLEDRAGAPVIVAELSDTAAVLDYNHPLAGKLLIVQITVLKVENPS